MSVLVLIALVTSIVALARARQRHRQEHDARAQVASLQTLLDTQRTRMQQCAEDLYVLQSLLVERQLIDDMALARGRHRFIESPRRLATEREAIQQQLGVPKNVVIIDDGKSRIH